MAQELLLPSFYLPTISYFKTIKDCNGFVKIEALEHFQKQTFRTRTKIATANGILELIVPIIHGKKDRVVMKDIRINYDHPWQRLHWLSIQTAYRSSAYFEYYEDDLMPFYNKKYEFLLDFNMEQLNLMLKLLKLDPSISLTEEYKSVEPNFIDYRVAIHPKKESLIPNQKPYYQTFEDKVGFIPDLSIVDLIFNQGPQAKNFL